MPASTESALSNLYAFEMERATTNESDLRKVKVSTVADIMGNDREIGRSEATLVITVWHEVEHHKPFRGRLVSTSGNAREAEITYAANREAVLSSVDEWLRKVTD